MSWFRPRPADIAIFHEFAPPPTGGGHQFMRALCRAFESKGLRLELNRLRRGTRAVLFNSYNFDFDALRRACARFPHVRRVHRIDGPLQTYRGFDDGTDRRIVDINLTLAQESRSMMYTARLDSKSSRTRMSFSPLVMPKASRA
jgi:hypothetical protein